MGSAAPVGRISMLGCFFMFQTALEQFCGVAEFSILLYENMIYAREYPHECSE